jgi:ABC-type transporter Mla MlaB component
MSKKPSISVEELPDGCRKLRLAGEISVIHAADLHRTAIQLVQEECDVRLECGELQSIDLAAGQILLALQSDVSLHGRRFRIDAASRDLAELLRFVGLGDAVATLPGKVGRCK